MIKAIVIDCDGVLSSGKQYVDHTGEVMFKDFHSRDIRAIRELVCKGIDVVVLSACDWPGIKAWCNRVGCRFIESRYKLETLIDQGFDAACTLVVGDDAWDVRAMQWAAYKAAPADASECVLSIEGVLRIDTEGGRGVVAALLERLVSMGLI